MTERYSPAFASWVEGRFPERQQDEVEGWMEQRIELRCGRCGETSVAFCQSGKPRAKIAKWALGHLHRDPLGGNRTA